jgi:hypothetical protein
MKQFFGPYIPPQQLDKAAAQTLSPGSYGEAINKAAPVMEILENTLLDIGEQCQESSIAGAAAARATSIALSM